MKIAMYIRPQGMCNPTGVGKHQVNILQALSKRSDVDLSLLASADDLDVYGLPEAISDLSVARLPYSRAVIERLWNYTNMPAVDRYVGNVDWVCSPVDTWIPTERIKSAITIHFDSWFEKDNPHYSGFSSMLSRLRAKVLYRRILQDANAVLTISEFMRSELCSIFNADASRIDIIGNGVESEYYDVQSSVDERDPFVLAIGGLCWRKGGKYLLRVADVMSELLPRYKIKVVCGQYSFPEELAEAKKRPNIELLGYISDKDVMNLMSKARCLLFLSRYEGFGIPVVEAMAAGLPVVASTYSALPETVGDAGVLVDACDSKLIVEQIERLDVNHEYREELIERGRKRAELFTWDACAERLLSALKERSR